MSKKIGFILDIYQSQHFSTGGERFNFNLIKALHEAGHLVDLLLLSKQSINLGKYINRVFYLEDLSSGSLEQIIEQNAYELVISEKAYVPQANLIYLHGHTYLYNNKAQLSPWFNIVRNLLDQIPALQSKKQKTFLQIKQILQNNNSKILVPSSVLAQDLIEYLKIPVSRIKIAHPPLSIEVSGTERKKQNNNGKNPIYTFGLIAGGFKRKGGYLTLQALRYLKTRKTNFRVRIICNFDSSTLWIARSLSFIYGLQEFTEFIPVQKDIIAFYQTLDCLLLPSLQESFGMVASEAMSLGVPVIASSACGYTDLIAEGVNGFVFPTKNALELATQMQNFVELKTEQKEQMSEQAINTVKHHTWANFVREFMKDY